MIQSKSDDGVRTIHKEEFLRAYIAARPTAFTEKTIFKSFSTTGIEPFNPRRVIESLKKQKKSPPPAVVEDLTYSPKTPEDRKSARRLLDAIQTAVVTGGEHTAEDTMRLVNMFANGYEKARIQLDFTLVDNKRLLEIEETRKRKRSQTRRQIKNGGSLTAAEANKIFSARPQRQNPQNGHVTDPSIELSEPIARNPRRYGICKIPGHRRETCPEGIGKVKT
ncbi:hypothetical protein JCM33374_g6573 [Metschnikowia sp. JCM 33374]|nr:hypothetical protein JCM33374_g6573 [Metschnikowia sp. JCM 33374]